MLIVASLLFAGLCLAQSSADFPLPPSVTNTTDACATTLNTTVSCPYGLLQKAMSGGLLDTDTLNAICVDACSSSLQSVRQSISQSCTSSDTVDAGGNTYPATYIADRLLYAYSLACRRDSGSNDFCDEIWSSWQDNPLRPNDTVLQCSDCALGLQQLQLDSPFGYTDTLASQFENITSKCNANSYSFTSPAAYAISTATIDTLPGYNGSCTTTYTVQPGDFCDSVAQNQSVSTFGLKIANGITGSCDGFPAVGDTLCLPATCSIYLVQPGDTCTTIIGNASISSVQFLTWNPSINSMCGNLMVGDVICLSQPGGSPANVPATAIVASSTVITAAPEPTNADTNSTADCGRWYTVQEGDYCQRISLTQGISLSDFSFLNPDIDANCTNLLLGVAYCVAPVGAISTYSGYPSTSNFITLTSMTYTTATTDVAQPWTLPAGPIMSDMPLAPNTLTDCEEYRNYQDPDVDIYDISDQPNNANDTRGMLNLCTFVTGQYGVNVTQLAQWNPSLSSNDTDCVLQSGYSYCVLRSDADLQPIEQDCLFTNDTMPGTTPQCNCFDAVHASDDGTFACSDIESAYNITDSEMLAWNTWLGSDCDTNLYANLASNDTRYVCVGIDPMLSNVTTTTSSAQMSSTSTVLSLITSSDTVSTSSTHTDSSSAQTSSTSTALASTTSSTSASSSAAPTASGVIAGCQDFYEVEIGDNCVKIEAKTRLSLLELILLNPFLGLTCTGLVVGFQICIKGPSL